MGALFGFAQFEARTAYHHIVAVCYECFKDFFEVESFGSAAYESHVVYAERSLHLRHLVQLVEYYVGIGVAFQFDNDAHACVVALVVYIGDAVEFFLVHEIGDIFNEFGFVYAIWYFMHHDGFVVGFLFYFGFGAYYDAPAAGMVSVPHAVVAVDGASGREVGSGDVLHQFVDADFRIVDERYGCVYAFREIVRGHIGGHAHGDAAGSIDEQVGEARGKHGGFAARVVVVGLEVHSVSFDVAKHFLAHLGETYFSVSHGGGSVAVHRAEVAVSVHEGVAQRPVLGHAHYGAVDGGVSVRVIFTHYFAHAVGRFLMRFVAGVAHLVHAEQHTAVYGLHAVAHVGQCA